ncbi:MAG: hypothetical protein PHW02_05140 [bacterium]|nr:hypothetical protein [bacterium]
MKYIPANEIEREKLLKEIGVSSFDKLIEYIPQSLRECCLNLQGSISEHELLK